ncbi:MAG: type II toxin-antitoxin system VapC family toxin [Solirubrobacteraceae bacterium]
MGVVLLDSVVIVAYLDATNVFHRSAVTSLEQAVRDESLIASAINYAELLTGAKLGHHDETITRGFFADLIAEVVPVGTTIAERAAEIRSQCSVRLPDALVLATADLHADRVVTADEPWSRMTGLGCTVELLRSS